MKLKDSLNNNNLKTLKLMQVELKNQEFKSIPFNDFENNLLDTYCHLLGYIISRNKQNKTIKIFNPLTHRFGYVQKHGKELLYGYFDKLNGNSVFIRKYSLNDTLFLFRFLTTSISYDARRDLLINTCGIIELESNLMC